MTDEPPTILTIGAVVWLNDHPTRKNTTNPIGFQADNNPQGGNMGHPYRQRHETPATTTSSDVAGLGTGTNATWTDNNTLAELKAEAEQRGLPTYGTKADLLERLNTK